VWPLFTTMLRRVFGVAFIKNPAPAGARFGAGVGLRQVQPQQRSEEDNASGDGWGEEEDSEELQASGMGEYRLSELFYGGTSIVSETSIGEAGIGASSTGRDSFEGVAEVNLVARGGMHMSV